MWEQDGINYNMGCHTMTSTAIFFIYAFIYLFLIKEQKLGNRLIF